MASSSAADLPVGGVAPPGSPECNSVDSDLDFDAVPGSADTAIGMPDADIGSAVDAGTVEVRFGCGGTPRVPQGISLPTPHAGDRFGASIAAVHLNNDDVTDLVVGIPGYDVGSASDAGAVAIFYGSSNGLVFSRILTQDSPGVPGSVQAGAHFGAVVVTHQGYGETQRTIRIGEPGKDVGSAVDTGGYVDLTYDDSGLVTASTAEVTLGSAGMPGPAQSGDLFGSSFWQLSTVGAPGRTVDGHPGAGAMVVLGNSGQPATLLTQNSPCMPGTAEDGDHFGASLSGGWVGVPDEDVGSAVDAGMVERWGVGSSSECIGLTQNSPGVDGTAEAGDHFGAAIDELYAYTDDTEYTPLGLLIGAPGEDTGFGVDSGIVDVMKERYDPDGGEPFAISGAGYQIGNYPNKGAALGSAFGVGQDIMVSSPGAFRGLGLVYAYGSVYVPELLRSVLYIDQNLQQSTGTLQNGVYGGSLLTDSD